MDDLKEAAFDLIAIRAWRSPATPCCRCGTYDPARFDLAAANAAVAAV